MRVIFQDLNIRFRKPILQLGVICEWQWVNAELVIVMIGSARYLLAITESARAHTLIYLKIFDKDWQFISGQRALTLKWGIAGVTEAVVHESFPMVEFSDGEHWWKGLQCFLELRDKVSEQASSVLTARGEFCQHLDSTFGLQP